MAGTRLARKGNLSSEAGLDDEVAGAAFGSGADGKRPLPGAGPNPALEALELENERLAKYFRDQREALRRRMRAGFGQIFTAGFGGY